MTTYNVYIENRLVAENVSGCDFAWEVYRKVIEVAEMLGTEASLVYAETGEVVDCSSDWDDYDHDYEPADIDSDCGFDPYMGCFSDDC